MNQQNEKCEECGIEVGECGLYWKTEEETLCAACADHKGYEIN